MDNVEHKSFGMRRGCCFNELQHLKNVEIRKPQNKTLGIKENFNMHDKIIKRS